MRLDAVGLAAHNAVFSVWNACAYFPLPLQTTALAFVPACSSPTARPHSPPPCAMRGERTCTSVCGCVIGVPHTPPDEDAPPGGRRPCSASDRPPSACHLLAVMPSALRLPCM